MNRRVAVCAGLLLLPLLVTALGYLAWYYRFHLIERNVREVDPGRIYAGGYQRSNPLARILERYQIKTVLSLRNLDVADEREELEILAGRGVVFRRVSMRALDPIPEALARVEEAVQIVADEQNHPVFVHCTAGMHRTGAVIAAYRFSYCGWSEEQALAELRRYANRSDETDWACKVFRAYCQRTGN